MNTSELKSRLQEKYDRRNWLQLAKDIFHSLSILQKPIDIPVNKDFVQSFQQLGFVNLKDGRNLAMIEVKVDDSRDLFRNKVELRNLTMQLIDEYSTSGVLVIFDNESGNYRFTFAARESEINNQTGQVEVKETNPRRFTYFLGPGESCFTAAMQLTQIAAKGNNAEIEDVVKAFNVEAVNKQFFNGYKQHYDAFVASLVAGSFKKSVFNGDEKAIRDFVKKMMGRIVFIYFLQKKGWMGVSDMEKGWTGGDPEFLHNLFKESGAGKDFYPVWLNAVFEALNTERKNDVFKLPNGTFCKIPYLNGGLFEREQSKTDLLVIKPVLFEALFTFFDQFNFTIYEDDPEERFVAVDPEMLGHIFENLLEDNKDKGAYYTPKEIVHYMCRESLVEYLCTSLEQQGRQLPRAALEGLVIKKTAKEVVGFEEPVLKALKEVKICDPAIGSGAFPMGLLHEIFDCVQLLHDLFPDATEDIWKMKGGWQPAKVKENIIQNSIYGVDIEKGAVDIARLRFWLSLIVEEEAPRALPNLDYKIVVGNSLLSKFEDEVIEIDWDIKNKNASAVKDIINDQQAKIYLLQTRQHLYFMAHSNKEKLQTEIRDLKIDVLVNQLKLSKISFTEKNPRLGGFAPTSKEMQKNLENELQVKSYDKTIQKLLSIKNDKGAPLHFFDWKLNFPEVMNEKVTKENIGFDILIGNPPYGQLFSETDKEVVRAKYPLLKFKIDIYPVFIILIDLLLKKGGHLSYIIPNTLLDNKNLEDLRRYLLNNYVIISLIDLDDQVFESATVHSMIFSTKKLAKEEYLIKCAKDGYNKFYEIPVSFFKSQDYFIFDLRSFEYDKLIQKLKTNSKRFQDVIDLKQTIKTGNDEKYIVSRATKKSHKPILRGKDIGKYSKKWSELYVDYGPHLANPIRNDIFEQPKILIREAGKEIIATYDDEDYYIMSSLYNGILKMPSDFELKFVLALVNSKIFQFLLNLITLDKTKGAFTKARIFHYYNLPIKNVPKKSQGIFTKMVDEILKRKSQGKSTLALEQQVDNLVYCLYDLTYAEVKVIDPEFPLSKKEYEMIKIG
jgi:hypothetical protein